MSQRGSSPDRPRQLYSRLMVDVGEQPNHSRFSTMRRQEDRAQSTRPAERNPANTLRWSRRILILGRTGSGKTTLARELAAAIGVPHVELDALYFGPNFSTVPLAVLRARTRAAISGDRWVTDGNKGSVRDLVWPRADTVIWLDYPLWVSLWRLGRRAIWRTGVLKSEATNRGGKAGLLKQIWLAARGVLTALRSHRGQRREYPRMFAEPKNQHLAVVQLAHFAVDDLEVFRSRQTGRTAAEANFLILHGLMIHREKQYADCQRF